MAGSMAIVRYLVTDVDASIAFYAVLGFELADRWGLPSRSGMKAISRSGSAAPNLRVEDASRRSRSHSVAGRMETGSYGGRRHRRRHGRPEREGGRFRFRPDQGPRRPAGALRGPSVNHIRLFERRSRVASIARESFTPFQRRFHDPLATHADVDHYSRTSSPRTTRRSRPRSRRARRGAPEIQSRPPWGSSSTCWRVP